MQSNSVGNKIRVAQITSQHSYMDARIREKECFSLATAGYDVVLLAPDAPDIDENNLKITGFDKPNGRLKRVTIGLWRLYKKTLTLKPDIVHFHDPDVILVGILLKIHGKKVIFDVHENFPNLAYDRVWVPPIAKWPLSILLSGLMRLSGFLFDGIVAATPSIMEMFPKEKSVTVRNMSRLETFDRTHAQPQLNPPIVCYVGGMSETRGFHQMLDAINIVNKDLECHLCLGGHIPEKLLLDSKNNPGWKYTTKMGFLTRKQVADLYSKCLAGLVVLAPSKNHVESLPIKMFEYMASTLPVIASNFPLWQNIIQENKCGICVSPDDPEELAAAITSIATTPSAQNEMGAQGIYCATTKYNWNIEEKKLLDFYIKIIDC